MIGGMAGQASGDPGRAGDAARAGDSGRPGDHGRPGGRPHTGRRRNEAAREAILTATHELLRAQGLQNLTIDAIAQAAGVGRQTIYRWWPSKGAMLAEAMGLQARIVVPPRDSGRFEADLTDFLTDSFRGLEDAGLARGLRDIAAAAQHDEHVAVALADFTAQRRAALRAVLERGRAQGVLGPDANLDFLVDLAYGLLWYRLLVGHAPLDAGAARDLAAHLIAAGAPPPDRRGIRSRAARGVLTSPGDR
jgi:AcrR family transcriptional regulator